MFTRLHLRLQPLLDKRSERDLSRSFVLKPSGDKEIKESRKECSHFFGICYQGVDGKRKRLIVYDMLTLL